MKPFFNSFHDIFVTLSTYKKVIFVYSFAVQKYSILINISLGLITLTTDVFSQNIENQLFVIKSRSDYRKWVTSNRHQLLPLADFVSPVYSSVPYSRKNNFTGKRLYSRHSFWILDEVGIRLQKIQDSLKVLGLSLYFFDTYRPYSVTKKMWEIVPDERYAANPAKGSGHNRGVAVDVTLASLQNGQPLLMPTGFDNFTDTAHHVFSNLPQEILTNRAILKGVMEYFGFRALSTEWWHYSLPDGSKYPLLDLNFRKLKKTDRTNSRY